MSKANGPIDQRLLSDLYDIAVYYSKQLGLLDLKSYNGLSNEHKSVHTVASREITILKGLMDIYSRRPELVILTSKESTYPNSKILEFTIEHPETLPEHEKELVNKYLVQLVIEQKIDNIFLRLKLAYNLSEEEVSHLGIEVVYAIDSFKALIAPYFLVQDNDDPKRYPLIAPSITNIIDEYISVGKGAQDTHLLIPDLHSRLLDLAVRLDYMASH